MVIQSVNIVLCKFHCIVMIKSHNAQQFPDCATQKAPMCKSSMKFISVVYLIWLFKIFVFILCWPVVIGVMMMSGDKRRSVTDAGKHLGSGRKSHIQETLDQVNRLTLNNSRRGLRSGGANQRALLHLHVQGEVSRIWEESQSVANSLFFFLNFVRENL